MAGPIGAIINLASKAKEAYNKKGNDPVIPVPGRNTDGPVLAQPSNQSNANMAADMLNVPGKEAIRKGMAKRKQMLDEL